MSGFRGELQVGGTLDPTRHLYIERRDAEDEVFRLLNGGEYCNILCPRQVGKSSLMVKTASRLQEAGLRVVTIDIGGELGSPRDSAEWYRGLLRTLGTELGLEVDIDHWWGHVGRGTANQRLRQFFRDRVCRDDLPPCVVFLDEIDSTLKLDYTDDFFTAIRSMYNERAQCPGYRNLTFCLIGVATANELIKNPRTTSYNVGRTILLRDFDTDEDDLSPLRDALGDAEGDANGLLTEVLYWTGGQPYLTLRLCQESIAQQLGSAEELKALVESEFGNFESTRSDVHFQQIDRFLGQRIADRLAAFRLYERILQGERVRDEASATHIQLKLSGLVTRDRDGCLVVRNRIYRKVFDSQWVSGNRPDRKELRLRRYAYTVTALLVLLLGGLSIGFAYKQLILEPPRRLANDLLEQMKAVTSEKEAFEIYLYLSGRKPHPELQRYPFPVDTVLTGFKPAADLNYKTILFRTAAEQSPNLIEEWWFEKWLRLRISGNEQVIPEAVEDVNAVVKDMELKGKYRACEVMAVRVLEIAEDGLGKEHRQTLVAAWNLGLMYFNTDRFVKGKEALSSTLELAKTAYGPSDPLVQRLESELKAQYQLQGVTGDTDTTSDKALIDSVMAKLREQSGTEPDGVSVVEVLSRITTKLHGEGRYDEAGRVARAALAEAERLLGTEHPQTLTSINNLAFVYQSQGRYGEAEPLYRRALAARERVLGAEHPNTLTSVNNLAFLYQSQGRYGEAESLYRRTLAARERVLGAEHPDTLQSVNNLAFLYQSQGRDGEAEPLYRRALATREKVLGAGHPDTLTSVNDLAALYQSEGRYGEAEPLYRRALATNEKVLGAEHPQTLRSVNNLAGLFESQGRYMESEPLYRRALTARKKVLGAEHPDSLTSVNDLGFLYQAQGRYDEAESLFRKALAARERQLGETHPDTIETQLNLAVTLINGERTELALEQLRIIDERLRTFVADQLDSTGSERVRRQWLQKESRLQDLVFTLALAHPDGPTAPLAADLLLRWKHFAVGQESVFARLSRTSQDQRVQELAARLRAARSEYSRLENLPVSDPASTAATLAEIERLETELSNLSRSFRGASDRRAVEWEAVRAALPRGGGLLELRLFRPYDFKTGEFGEDHWLALLLTAEGAAVPAPEPEKGQAEAAAKSPKPPPALRILDLGPVAATAPLHAELDRLTRESCCPDALVADPKKPPACASSDRAAADLYRALFGHIDADLAAFGTLFIAPDGPLALVPLARLRLPDGRYWIERQPLRVIGTGRDLLPTQPAPEGSGMLALGGIDYEHFEDAGPDQAASSAPDPDRPSRLPAVNPGPRPILASFAKLRWTGPEVQEIGGYFETYSGRAARVLTGRQASEGSLAALPQPPLVLHLATKSFAQPAGAVDPDRPLTRAGLALAGANRGLKGQVGRDGRDGILYALEVLDLNLEGTRLVTLSGCDTGRGALDRSEGVYGLARAFQVAGAQNVLVSLWPLDDALARTFMTDFYRRWLAAGTGSDPAEALRAVQLDWIRAKDDPRRRDPVYWAPFVLVERR